MLVAGLRDKLPIEVPKESALRGAEGDLEDDRPSLAAPQAFPRGLVGGSAVPVALMHWSVQHECADHSVMAAPTHPAGSMLLDETLN